MVSTAKVEERQDLHRTPLHRKTTKNTTYKQNTTTGSKKQEHVILCVCVHIIYIQMKTPTWSYRGVLHGLQLGSALSGRLELRGKLSPCGGEGLVQASGYSAENVSKPPEKKTTTHGTSDDSSESKLTFNYGVCDRGTTAPHHPPGGGLFRNVVYSGSSWACRQP